MRYNTLTALMLALVVFGAPGVARAQGLWDQAAQGANPHLQYGPNSIYGGFSFYTPETHSRTILRGGLSTGGLCGFDFAANLVDMIQELLDDLPDLILPILVGVGFMVTCMNFPSACDTFKHIHQWINFALRMQRASCQDMMELGQLAGIYMRGEQEADCVRTTLANTGSINVAIDACSTDGLGSILGPNGLRAANINVVQDVLESAGVDPAVTGMIAARVPNITLQTDGSVLTAASEVAPEPTLASVRTKQMDLAEEITAAVEIIESGGTPPPIALPGQPIPVAALGALSRKRMAPAMRDYHIMKLAYNLALAWETWDLEEAASQLRQAVSVSDVPPSQRALLDEAHRSLLSEVQRLRRMKESMDLVAPQLEMLMAQSQQQNAVAAQVSERARSEEAPPSFWSGMPVSVWGYRQ